VVPNKKSQFQISSLEEIPWFIMQMLFVEQTLNQRFTVGMYIWA
jgi:hypothetical protein